MLADVLPVYGRRAAMHDERSEEAGAPERSTRLRLMRKMVMGRWKALKKKLTTMVRAGD